MMMMMMTFGVLPKKCLLKMLGSGKECFHSGIKVVRYFMIRRNYVWLFKEIGVHAGAITNRGLKMDMVIFFLHRNW